MTTEKIQEIVIHVIGRQLEIPERKIEPGTRLADDLGADSLDQAEIVMDLEDEFDIAVSDDDAKSIKTIAEVVAYIERQISGS